ncbi:uncharacterized protein si:ch211-170d8.2 [Kryptolebias marmoratus]|uniref:Uncharacterized LOC108234963 n=1 Tax=Kryptolebias marmoratus TaxID=37003 RepID=A0A3Q3AF80_KRYMA|nr:uncharacterized protein si:ch211-170d8.2 [Kryptolebias marmoratus]
MAASDYTWTALFFISVTMSAIGVSGRAVDPSDGSSEPLLRTGALRRWRRGAAGAHRERCAELEAPWLENARRAPGDGGTRLQLRVRPFLLGASQGLVFPGKALFSFVRRVYRCCQEGGNCRRVRGIQGRLRGDAGVEFVLTREIVSLPIWRAELHLQLSNPQHLDVHPVILFRAKHNFPTRYSLSSQGGTLELRVDLLFLFHHLQEVAGGAGRGSSLLNVRRVKLFFNDDPPGETPPVGVLQDVDGDAWGDGVVAALPALDLGLILGCSRAGAGVPCEGVHLQHPPFMALYYR